MKKLIEKKVCGMLTLVFLAVVIMGASMIYTGLNSVFEAIEIKPSMSDVAKKAPDEAVTVSESVKAMPPEEMGGVDDLECINDTLMDEEEQQPIKKKIAEVGYAENLRIKNIAAEAQISNGEEKETGSAQQKNMSYSYSQDYDQNKDTNKNFDDSTENLKFDQKNNEAGQKRAKQAVLTYETENQSRFKKDFILLHQRLFETIMDNYSKKSTCKNNNNKDIKDIKVYNELLGEDFDRNAYAIYNFTVRLLQVLLKNSSEEDREKMDENYTETIKLQLDCLYVDLEQAEEDVNNVCYGVRY